MDALRKGIAIGMLFGSGNGGHGNLMTKTATENGVYTAAEEIDPETGEIFDPPKDGYSEVTVSVQTASLGPKFITENGTYIARTDDNLDGYSQVVVDVGCECSFGILKIHEAWNSIPSVPNYYLNNWACSISFYIINTTTGKFVGRNGTSGYIKDYDSYSSGDVVTEEPLFANVSDITMTLPAGTYRYVEYRNPCGTLCSSRTFEIHRDSVFEFTAYHDMYACAYHRPSSNYQYTFYRNLPEHINDNNFTVISEGLTYPWSGYSGDVSHYQLRGRPQSDETYLVYGRYRYSPVTIVANTTPLTVSTNVSFTQEEEYYTVEYYDKTASLRYYNRSVMPIDDWYNKILPSLTINDQNGSYDPCSYTMLWYNNPAGYKYWNWNTSSPLEIPYTVYSSETEYTQYNGQPIPRHYAQTLEYDYSNMTYKEYTHECRSANSGDDNAFSYAVHHSSSIDESLYAQIWTNWTSYNIPSSVASGPLDGYNEALRRIGKIRDDIDELIEHGADYESPILPIIESGIRTYKSQTNIFSPPTYSGDDSSKLYLFVGVTFVGKELENKLTYTVP